MKAGAGQTGLSDATGIRLPSAEPPQFRGKHPGAEQPPSPRRTDAGAPPDRQQGAGMNAGAGQRGLSGTRGIGLPSADPAELRGKRPSAGRSPSVFAPTGALDRPVLSVERAA
ncbi:hypothetical protein [Streptomyces sp. TLI_185]|uniref:hypothetical protein n=1 Tax=Streptomyces sp. TLI_185 TaxID=2485151 RepID=UPI000F4F023D|nr:hypothetical protein [Streptomyces sp. TLI_185]RPF36954.1 hypothetical protein EDD92_7012 [Streptomyces sp. TLI_185]